MAAPLLAPLPLTPYWHQHVEGPAGDGTTRIVERETSPDGTKRSSHCLVDKDGNLISGVKSEEWPEREEWLVDLNTSLFPEIPGFVRFTKN